jgi:hypothetical protein
MKKTQCVIVGIFMFSVLFGQNCSVNLAVDTINLDKKQIAELWINYLHSKPDSLYNNPYWNSEEKNKFVSYDLLKSEGFLSPSLYYFNWNNIILSISQLNNNYLIRSAFYIEGRPNIMAITNVLAIKENEKFVLANYSPYYTKKWSEKQVGIIKYRYYPDYKFDNKKAKEANLFLGKIYRAFNLNREQITYYISKDCDDIFRTKGFDHVITMGNGGDCGFFDRYNNIVYASALGGENHQHELTHIINKYFPNTHYIFLCGITAYLGGERAQNAKPLLFHIKRLNEYLKNHPELDLNNLSTKEASFMDYITNPQYVYGAILIDKALELSGIDGLKMLMSKPVTDETLSDFIVKELKINNNVNDFLRQRIDEISTQNKFVIKEF